MKKSIFKSATFWVALVQMLICIFPLDLFSNDVRAALILSSLKDIMLRAKTSEGISWK